MVLVFLILWSFPSCSGGHLKININLKYGGFVFNLESGGLIGGLLGSLGVGNFTSKLNKRDAASLKRGVAWSFASSHSPIGRHGRSCWSDITRTTIKSLYVTLPCSLLLGSEKIQTNLTIVDLLPCWCLIR